MNLQIQFLLHWYKIFLTEKSRSSEIIWKNYWQCTRDFMLLFKEFAVKKKKAGTTGGQDLHQIPLSERPCYPPRSFCLVWTSLRLLACCPESECTDCPRLAAAPRSRLSGLLTAPGIVEQKTCPRRFQEGCRVPAGAEPGSHALLGIAGSVLCTLICRRAKRDQQVTRRNQEWLSLLVKGNYPNGCGWHSSFKMSTVTLVEKLERSEWSL